MHNWIDTLCDIVNESGTACLVSVAKIRGSAPRDAGARMVVTPNGIVGTIGGGQLEYQCTRLAVERLAGAVTMKNVGMLNTVRTFPLGTNCGQCCGGVVEVHFENISVADAGSLHELKRLRDQQQEFVAVSGPRGRALVVDGIITNFGLSASRLETAARIAQEMCDRAQHIRCLHDSGEVYLFERIAVSNFNLAIFGAGHVGSAVVATLAVLDSRIRWIDSRTNVLPENVPTNVLAIESDAVASEVAAMPPASYFLIMTHSHALDLEICDQVLRRRDARYCGLIGSLSKRRRFERLLRKQGMVDEMLANLVCPIGIAGIPGKRPQEIAVAVAAELLQIRASSAKMTDFHQSDNVHAIQTSS